MFKLVFIIFGFLCFIPHAKADCSACSELRKVSITYINGQTVQGYIEWNPVWRPEDVDLLNSEGSIILQSMQKAAKQNEQYAKEYLEKYGTTSENPYYIYTDIVVFNSLPGDDPEPVNPYIPDYVPGTAYVLKENKKIMNPLDVQTLTVLHDKYNGINSTWGLNVITKKTLKLMRQKPFAKYCYDTGGADECLISYNTEYNKDRLQKMLKDNYSSGTEYKEMPADNEFGKLNILHFTYGYD